MNEHMVLFKFENRNILLLFTVGIFLLSLNEKNVFIFFLIWEFCHILFSIIFYDVQGFINDETISFNKLPKDSRWWYPRSDIWDITLPTLTPKRELRSNFYPGKGLSSPGPLALKRNCQQEMQQERHHLETFDTITEFSCLLMDSPGYWCWHDYNHGRFVKL